MTEKNERWFDDAGNHLAIETDPQGDAVRAQEKRDEEAPKGVKFVGGGQSGKTDKGVKRVSRRGTE